MSTKRFSWKDRDNAALDLIQLVYHAPEPVSLQALHILSAIRSLAIVPDLKAIVLDSEGAVWERIYALRAIEKVPSEIYFPELSTILDNDLATRQRIISSHSAVLHGIKEPHEIYIPNDMIDAIISFVAIQESNRSWLFEHFDQADPQVVSIVLANQLYIQRPEEFKTFLLHRLILLLETTPNLLTLFSIYLIYGYARDDEKARAFLEKNFHTIVDKVVSINLDDMQQDLPSTIPFKWPELRAAIFRLRPDIEQKYHRDQAGKAARFTQWEGKTPDKIQAEGLYKETATWHELEALYERAHNGDQKATRELYRKSYQEDRSIPARALATHFLGKLHEQHGVFGELAYLAHWPCDMWENDFSPVRSEAGHALFEIGTVQAWETLIATCFANPSPTLNTLLSYWIELLTDKLSGAEPKPTQFTHGIEAYQIHWFKALLEEKAP